MAVSRNFYIFTALGAWAGNPGLVYGAIDPTIWSFKYIKASDSTFAQLAKVVLPIKYLICCFNIPFSFLPTLLLVGYRGDRAFI